MADTRPSTTTWASSANSRGVTRSTMLSLAMAPAFVIAQKCRYVDIDGPLLQSEDCEHGMNYEKGRVDVFTPALWG